MLTYTTVQDNQFLPGIQALQYVPDGLIAGNQKLVTGTVTIGAGVLPRGTVLGQQSAAPVTAAAAGNVGNGAIGAISKGPAALIGTYYLRATGPTTFTVVAPTEDDLPDATVGTPYISAGINFTLTAGATPFAAGDTFTFTNAAANYVLSVATAVDGSQFPTAILADYADASGGPVTAPVYFQGQFSASAITIDASWTALAVTPLLRLVGITLKAMSAAMSSADPL